MQENICELKTGQWKLSKLEHREKKDLTDDSRQIHIKYICFCVYTHTINK